MGKVHWIRSNGFILGMLLVVVVAFLFPEPGARGGWLQPALLNNAGIALILFLQGVSLALEKIRSSAGNWRLHLVIQGFTFIVFPAVGIAFDSFLPWVWSDVSPAVQRGFLFLCVLPSTISTSVVLTAVAGGNTAGALFNAAFSNIIGVFLTPLFVHLLMRASGESANPGPLLLKITGLTLVPFAAGMLLRPRFRHWIDRHKAWVTRLSNGVVLFIVYTAFCDSVAERLWQTQGWSLIVKVLLGVAFLFTLMSGLIAYACRRLGFNRPDAIAAYFCSVKKTLAMGVPLAILIFGQGTDLSLILLPVMLYHPLQLFVNGMLANHWARQVPQNGHSRR